MIASDLAGHVVGGKAEPYGQTHQDVTQNAAEERFRDAERDLGLRDCHRGFRDRATAELERSGPGTMSAVPSAPIRFAA